MKRRKDLFKKTYTEGSAKSNLRDRAAMIRSRRREKNIMGKRLKRDSNAVIKIDIVSDEDLKVALNGIISFPATLSNTIEHLKLIRKSVTHEETGDHIIDVTMQFYDGKVMEKLAEMLAYSDYDIAIEAAWCITNLSSTSNRAYIRHILRAAPTLIHLLSSPNHVLVEQVAFALANLGAEDSECRSTLTANGVIPSLINALRLSIHHPGEEKPSTKENILSLQRTIAWSISNMARGSSTSCLPFLNAGILDVIPALLPLMDLNTLPSSDGSMLNVATEALWIISYLTAREDEVVDALIKSGLARRLILYFSYFVSAKSFIKCLPVIRSIGNLCCGKHEWRDSVLSIPECIPCLKELLELYPLNNNNAMIKDASGYRTVLKESMWVVSNLIGSSLDVANLLIKIGFLPSLTHHFVNGSFKIKTEALYSLSNIASIKPEYLSQIISVDNVLSSFIHMIESPDQLAVRAALRVVELVLRHYPKGIEIVEALDGISALESLQFQEDMNHELVCISSGLIDEFYGEDVGFTDDNNDEYDDIPGSSNIGEGFNFGLKDDHGTIDLSDIGRSGGVGVSAVSSTSRMSVQGNLPAWMVNTNSSTSR